MFMKRSAVLFAAVLIFGACAGTATTPPGGTSGGISGAGCTVGVSWNNFQQRRWAATDKPNMKKFIEDAGGKFIDKDANLNTLQQITDVSTLISQGAKVIVLLAQDPVATEPAIKAAKDARVPVIAYDRLAEDPDVLYLTFDNAGVGVAEATAILTKVPKGNYVVIKGDPGDPNAATFLRGGYDTAGLKAKVDSGDIKILAEQFTQAWDTTKAQNNMEAIIDKAVADNTQINAVLAENDSTALGVAAAFKAKNYPVVPLSGQDGDPANLNNVAKGLQYVDVWKNSNELGKAAGQAALQLCAGKAIKDISVTVDASVAPAAGNSPTDFKTPAGNTVKSITLKVTPLTADNLNIVIDGGWITKADLCKGVDAATAPPACK